MVFGVRRPLAGAGKKKTELANLQKCFKETGTRFFCLRATFFFRTKTPRQKCRSLSAFSSYEEMKSVSSRHLERKRGGLVPPWQKYVFATTRLKDASASKNKNRGANNVESDTNVAKGKLGQQDEK